MPEWRVVLSVSESGYADTWPEDRGIMEKLFKFIKDLIAAKFYGTIEIKVEAGTITLVRKIETIKL